MSCMLITFKDGEEFAKNPMDYIPGTKINASSILSFLSFRFFSFQERSLSSTNSCSPSSVPMYLVLPFFLPSYINFLLMYQVLGSTRSTKQIGEPSNFSKSTRKTPRPLVILWNKPSNFVTKWRDSVI
jgi:hypothetical protein